MLTFLFWNINRKPLVELITSLAKEHAVDILILAESGIPIQELLKHLNSSVAGYHFPFSQCRGITVIVKFQSDFLNPIFESDRVSIRHLTLPLRSDLLLATAHLPSKLYFSAESQSFELSELARTINDVEVSVGHRRTLLIGDLNANPFDAGVVGAAGLNGAMSRSIAMRSKRTIQGREYPFFYNPMWGLFGDKYEGPPGTYFYERAEHVTYFWHLFDQILLRPELLEYFDNDQLRILTKAGDFELSERNGTPDLQSASDHFPILLNFNL
jgi:hypothetical protein